ncbi:MAG: GNAT family N-acetyltransferase [Candidatus Lustribacter sp.]
MPLELRPVEVADIEPLARICFEAFRSIAERHNFPPDFPSVEVATAVIGHFVRNPAVYGIAAELGGRVVGSNFLEERSAISGVGPITIDPAVHDSGIGRRLMQAVIERSDARGFVGCRLLQAAYHMRSLSLYTKLGFAPREELVSMTGVPADPAADRFHVRPATERDIVACDALCTFVHGFARHVELQQTVAAGSAFVVERDGALAAYTTGLGYRGHTVGESNDAVAALLVKAPHQPGRGALVPVRNDRLFRWCLEHGMRAVQTMTLMSRGIYQDPQGPFLPSITY